MNALYEAIKGTDIEYTYTMVKSDGEILYTSSSASPDAVATGEYDGFLSKYSDASPVLRQPFESSDVSYENYEDSEGYFRSIFIPYTAADGTRFIAGADISMHTVNSMLIENLFISLAEGGMLLLFIVPLLWTLWRKSKEEKEILQVKMGKSLK